MNFISETHLTHKVGRGDCCYFPREGVNHHSTGGRISFFNFARTFINSDLNNLKLKF